MIQLRAIVTACAFSSLVATARGAEPAEVIDLWPEKPPGFQVEGGPERDTSGPEGRPVAGRPVVRLGFVSEPEIHVYRPADGTGVGTAVVVCPGGGFNILAWDLEGTEVAEWLNSVGVTAAVLKYRAPTAKADPNWLPPVQDAQRAVSLVRAKAGTWGLAADRVGILGFSAGGKAAAMTALANGRRAYEPVDAADETSCRPDFAALVYPAYLVGDDGRLRPEVVVTNEAPPTFLAHAYDDKIGPANSVRLFEALKEAGVPAELHVYSTGGHGYGLRPTDQPVTAWPKRCEEWMRTQGLLAPAD